MAKNKNFDLFTEQKKNFMENAVVHPDTKFIDLGAPILAPGVTEESLKAAVDYLNVTGLAGAAATGEIAIQQFPEHKHENWDSRCEVFGVGVINNAIQLREELDGKFNYGVITTAIDHPYTDAQTALFQEFSADLAAKAQGLF